MVVAPALKGAAWLGAAVLAVGLIVVLAFYGQRPDSSLARFEAGGAMLSIMPDTVSEVIVSRGESRWRFSRSRAGEWTTADGGTTGSPLRGHIDSGLRFLHVSAPQRVLQPDELTATSRSDFGLEPPRFSVSVRSSTAESFRIDFGSLNAQGLAQYAQVSGHAEVLLLPSFVGDEWKAVLASR